MMENVELGTQENVMEIMMENTVPGSLVTKSTFEMMADKTVMENNELGTQENVMEIMMENTVP